ncbi:peptidase C15 [Baaleninema sp.]|uniref:pyroglutamyl-peptidase I family protein n=1 Tax=Baaleninema sp. TaxID=3101197 RepID=UPI003CFEB1EE
MNYDFAFTSFDTWLPHQTSNSSDELLAALHQLDRLPPSSLLVRRLRVDTQIASAIVLDRLRRFRPRWVVCCGMAESRSTLAVEVQAKQGSSVCRTPVDVPSLVSELSMTEISYDAGNFVCNDLYYRLLSDIRSRRLPTMGLFVHVPPLTAENHHLIETEFLEICQRLKQLTPNFAKISPPESDRLTVLSKLGVDELVETFPQHR